MKLFGILAILVAAELADKRLPWPGKNNNSEQIAVGRVNFCSYNFFRKFDKNLTKNCKM